MARIQLLTILANLLFLLYIGRLILQRKLREEYAIVWLVMTILIGIFSIWPKGLDRLALTLGVYAPPNLIFTGFVFIILIYLLHLSVSNSQLQKKILQLAQEMALLKQERDAKKN